MAETGFRAGLPRIRVPTLLVQGDNDASAPLPLTGARVAQLIPDCQFKIYQGAPHALMFTHMARLHADLLEFVGARSGLLTPPPRLRAAASTEAAARKIQRRMQLSVI